MKVGNYNPFEFVKFQQNALDMPVASEKKSENETDETAENVFDLDLQIEVSTMSNSIQLTGSGATCGSCFSACQNQCMSRTCRNC